MGDTNGYRDLVARMILAIRSMSITADQAMAHRVPVEFASNSSVLVLGVLASSTGLRPRDLLGHVPITSGGLSKLLDRFVDQGLVERSDDAGLDDGRAVEVRLTRRGRETYRRLTAAADEAFTDAASQVKEVLSLCAEVDPRPRARRARIADAPISISAARLGLELTDACEALPDVEAPVELGAAVTLAALRVEGPLRPRRIAEVVGLSSGGTTKMIDRMVERGWVERTALAVAGDRRAVVVDATAAGRAFGDQVLDAWGAHVEQIHDVMRSIDAHLGLS